MSADENLSPKAPQKAKSKGESPGSEHVAESRPTPAPLPAPAPAPAPAAAPPAGVSAPESATVPVPAPAPSAAPAPVQAAPAAQAPVSATAPPAEHEPEDEPEDDESLPTGPSRFLLFAAMPSWLVSLVLHTIIILLLALWYLPSMPVFNTDLTIGTQDVVDTEVTNMEENAAEVDFSAEAITADVTAVDVPVLETEDPALVDDPLESEAAAMNVELSNIGFEAAASNDLMQEIGEFTGSGLSGRSAAEKTRLVREAGGTKGSEQAVKRALQWLKRHQHPDGGWNFYHLEGRCPCNGHGTMSEARVGATAMALLPFLGAGNTHMEGNYKAEVHKGLYFLANRQAANGALWEDGGRMYSHGLAAIVLCEAYAMTGDKNLRRPAQAALDYINYAQAPITGGWRYQPKDLSGGDTSVVGWQLMALKSGHMADLRISRSAITGTKRFLNSVQANDGATYGYMGPGEKGTTSAIGLLCRMYLGWSHDHPPLVNGVQRLGKSGPSKVDMYFNYYATQVMRHYGGEPWEEWNEEMRDYLVKTQSRKGHAEGSWLMGKRHTDKGGRLYCTAMATMILEVYYRHLPIYGKKASDVDFEL